MELSAAKVEQITSKVTATITVTLARIGKLVLAVALVAGMIGAATFATGLQIFDGDTRPWWVVVGLAICIVPLGAALIGWWQVRSSARYAPALINDIRSFVSESQQQAKVLIDHDSGQPITVAAKSLGVLRQELNERRHEFPALFAGVKAITGVPGLAAVAVVGSVIIGALGTVLLIGWLVG